MRLARTEAQGDLSLAKDLAGVVPRERDRLAIFAIAIAASHIDLPFHAQQVGLPAKLQGIGGKLFPLSFELAKVPERVKDTHKDKATDAEKGVQLSVFLPLHFPVIWSRLSTIFWSFHFHRENVKEREREF